MKKIILVLLFMCLIFSIPLNAQTWLTANQVTIGWDAVDTLNNGAPLPMGTIAKYKVYIKTENGTPIEIEETDLLQSTITFTIEGNWFVGVSSVRYVDGKLTNESPINWSNVNGESTPDPFGLRFYQNLEPPKGLKMQ